MRHLLAPLLLALTCLCLPAAGQDSPPVPGMQHVFGVAAGTLSLREIASDQTRMAESASVSSPSSFL